MAQLYTLTAGKSKAKQKRVMTDVKSKCENFKQALASSGNKDFTWFEIRPAVEGEEVYKRNSSSQWTGYDVFPKVRK